ncbi:TolC family protein [uncultured Paludibaculum sp.]|uniref:TolC family protein n=1 Tax=uncultured Paludibaculum sp. TaxID=1765020 RepID=UPI002AAB9D87|nr:TolC family protein [uncultured Paludibaculum sp.]
MRWPPVSLLTLVLGAAASPVAQGQVRLGLQDAIQLALEKNAYLAAGEQRIGASKGLGQQAALKPNPRVYLQQENARFWQSPGLVYWRDTDTFAYAGLTVESGGKRERRVDYAVANTARVEADQALLRRQLAARVASAYWTAAGAQRVVSLLNEERQNLLQVVQYTQSRVKEGAAAGADLLRIQLEAQRVDTLLAVAQQEAERSRLDLYREIGVAAPDTVEFSDPLDDLRGVAVPDAGEVLGRRPEVLLARRGVAQAEAHVRLQLANAKPDPDYLFGYKRTAGFDSLIVGVQINLPTRNRNQGLIAASEADLRAAKETLRAVEAQISAEFQSAVRDYELKRKLVSGDLPGMVQRSRDSARIAQFAFREGGVDVLRLLDAERIRIETQLLYTRSLADFQQSVVTLEVATGVNP